MTVDIGHAVLLPRGQTLKINNEPSAPHVKKTLDLLALSPIVAALYYLLAGMMTNAGNMMVIPIAALCGCLAYAVTKMQIFRSQQTQDGAHAESWGRCCHCWWNCQVWFTLITALFTVIAAGTALSDLADEPLVCNVGNAAKLENALSWKRDQADYGSAGGDRVRRLQNVTVSTASTARNLNATINSSSAESAESDAVSAANMKLLEPIIVWDDEDAKEQRSNKWLRAEWECQKRGRHLITFCDATEYDALKARKDMEKPLKKVHRSFWIGYTNKRTVGDGSAPEGHVEGNFYWDAIGGLDHCRGKGGNEYRGWSLNEPNNWGFGEECASILLMKSFSMRESQAKLSSLTHRSLQIGVSTKHLQVSASPAGPITTAKVRRGISVAACRAGAKTTTVARSRSDSTITRRQHWHSRCL